MGLYSKKFTSKMIQNINKISIRRGTHAMGAHPLHNFFIISFKFITNNPTQGQFQSQNMVIIVIYARNHAQTSIKKLHHENTS